MINLVIISPGFPVSENDSVCLPFLQLFIKSLIKSGQVQLTVITEQYPAKENYTWNNITVITLRKKEPAVYYKLLRYHRLKNILKKINGQHKIHVIHNFWFTRSALIAGEFASKHDIKHITTFAGQDVLAANKNLKKLASYKGILFCFSEFQRIKLLESTAVNAAVIGLGIEEIGPPPEEKNIDLIFCGWISDLKNYHQFVEIVADVHKTHKLNKVAICGGGDGLPALKEKIRSLGLQDLISVKGETPRADVLALMRKSRILVHTSAFESFGLVLVEALACGCYVISKPVGIAYHNPDIITCLTNTEFVMQVIACLDKGPKNDLPQTTYPVSETVNDYIRIYKS